MGINEGAAFGLVGSRSRSLHLLFSFDKIKLSGIDNYLPQTK